MREKNRKPIASIKKLPQFTTMNVIDGQAGLVNYSSLIFYSLTIDNILNIIVLLILAGVTISALSGDNGILQNAIKAKEETEASGDIEQITILISENQIKEHILGEKLKEIEFNITENTKSIINSITGEIYGNGWYYLTPQNSEELQL